MAIAHVVASAGLSLVKRVSSREEESHVGLSLIAFVFIVAILLVFIPFLIWTSYTLLSIYPTLAIVEDPNPPAYEPVSLSDNADDPAASASSGRLVTSSFRSIHRLLHSTGGIRAHFRGLGCAFVISIGKTFVGGIFETIPFVPTFVGTILAMLALIQLYTAWVHIVITPADVRPFWKRLPPFKKTFEATVIPVAILGVAELITTASVFLTAVAIGFPLWSPSKPSEVPDYQAHHAWKSLIVLIVGIVLTLGLVYPAHVVLVRVQASLLPPDEDAILPFDRSFGGTIEPAVVSGKGYATWTNALKTFPRSSWIRLYKLMVTVFAFNMAIFVVLFSILGGGKAVIGGR